MFNWITIWLLWYSVFYSLLDSVCYKAILVRSTLTLFSLYWVSFFIALGQFLPFFSLYWVILPFFSLYWVVLPSFHYIGSVFTLFSLKGFWPSHHIFLVKRILAQSPYIVLGHFALFPLYWVIFTLFLIILRTLFLPHCISTTDFINVHVKWSVTEIFTLMAIICWTIFFFN